MFFELLDFGFEFEEVFVILFLFLDEVLDLVFFIGVCEVSGF